MKNKIKIESLIDSLGELLYEKYSENYDIWTEENALTGRYEIILNSDNVTYNIKITKTID